MRKHPLYCAPSVSETRLNSWYVWKRGRVAEGTGLENRRRETVLEFESLRFHHQIQNPGLNSPGFFV